MLPFLTLVTLAACGSAGPAGPSAGAIPHVSTPPSAPALAAVSHAVATTVTLTGAFDMAFSDVPVASRSATPKEASGAVDFGGPASTIRLELPAGSGGTEQMVFLPGTVFIKPPASSPPLQAGKPWIFANFADIDKYRVNFPPYIVQTESVNPAFVVYELLWGATSAVPLGRTVLAGQEADAYVVTVDLDQALAHSTGPGADVFGHALTSEISAFGGSTATAPPTLTAEAWVDGAGRLIGARATPPGAGIGTLTLDVTRFGVPVHADKPPRAKVVDIAAMIPGGEQEALNGGDSDGA
ncbi:MAG: hypothetical protein ACRDYE_03690 [Acidimicrobiales bacterium]